MPINSSAGVAEDDHEPEWLGDRFGAWLDDFFQDSFWSPGGRQDVGGNDWFGVSVGLADIPFLGRSGTIVPPVVSIPDFNPTITIPETVDSTMTALPVPGTTVSWGDWAAAGNPLPNDWNQYPHASDHPNIGGSVAASPPPGGDDVSILGDIYDWVDDNLAGGYLPGGTQPGGTNFPMAPGPSFALPTTPVVVGGNGGVTPIPGTGGPVAAACGPVMIYNSKTGKWTKKRHRRRRQLATRSDIRDLSALKGVLGQGKLLEVWIATHS